MHAAENEIEIELEVGGIVTRGEDWGGQLVRHLTLPPGADFTPLFKGLPDDRCQCAHWGYVLEGSITVRYADGTEIVEFSPTVELQKTMAVVGANMQAGVGPA